MGGADFYRDYVPNVERDHVGGDEVDVAFGVGDVAAAYGISGAGFVGCGADGVGAFDLDAEEVDLGLGTIVEDEVVALAVSPGLADGEAALAGLVEEGASERSPVRLVLGRSGLSGGFDCWSGDLRFGDLDFFGAVSEFFAGLGWDDFWFDEGLAGRLDMNRS